MQLQLQWCSFFYERKRDKKTTKTQNEHGLQNRMAEMKMNEREQQKTVKLETKFHDAIAYVRHVMVGEECGGKRLKQTYFAHTHISVNKQWIKRTLQITTITNANTERKKGRKKRGARSTRITSRNLPLNIRAVADKTYHPWQTENRRRKYGN